MLPITWSEVTWEFGPPLPNDCQPVPVQTAALPIGTSTIEIVAHTASNLTRTYAIEVVRQEPEIGFVLGAPIPGVGMITTVAAVEVDGNVKPDLLFTTYDGDVGVVVNVGNQFVGRTYLPMVATRSVAVAEVTGDTFPDLLISDGPFYIARGKGDGTFEPPFARAFADAGTIAMGALDTDGRPDVMVADGPGRVTALLNDGASMVMGPSWQPGANPGEPRVVVNAPLDLVPGDETLLLDTLASSITVFSYGNAALAMSQVPLGAAAAPRELVAADFDGDARADIAWIDPYTGNVVVQTKFPNWTRTPFHVGTSPRALTVGDVDGDGARDLVVLDNQQLVVLFNDGTAGFTQRRFPELGAGAVDVEVVDLDHDGRQDMIFANQTSSMTYARGVLQ